MARDKKGAARKRATILFADESGISLIPFVAKTWARRGRTPLVRHRYAWPKVSAISAITPRGRLYFQVHRGSIKTLEVIHFLRHLLRHVRGRIVLLWDGLAAHWSAATRQFIQAHPRLTVYRLPPYCPDLNPDEWFWAHLKTKHLANGHPNDLNELRRALRLAVVRIRRRPKVIASFCRAAGLYK